MVAIANDLGKEWMWVGRLLQLEDTSLDDIKESHEKQYECSYEMLLLWTRKSSTQATYDWLARVLLHRVIGMREIAEKYCLEHTEQQSGKFIIMMMLIKLFQYKYEKCCQQQLTQAQK